MGDWRACVLAVLVGLVGARSGLPTFPPSEVRSPPVQAVKADRAAAPAVRWVRDDGVEVAPRPRWVPPLERLRSDFPEQLVAEGTPPPQAPAPMSTGDVDQLRVAEPMAELEASLRVEGAASKAKVEASAKSRVAEAEDKRPPVKNRNDVCAQNGGWARGLPKGRSPVLAVPIQGIAGAAKTEGE
jgi:hypothetical protein